MTIKKDFKIFELIGRQFESGAGFNRKARQGLRRERKVTILITKLFAIFASMRQSQKSKIFVMFSLWYSVPSL